MNADELLLFIQLDQDFQKMRDKVFEKRNELSDLVGAFNYVDRMEICAIMKYKDKGLFKVSN